MSWSSSEVEAFVELVGGLASGDAALVTADQVGVRWAAAAADFVTAVARLTDTDDRRNPLLESRLIGRLFQQGRHLQEEAMFGRPPRRHAGDARRSSSREGRAELDHQLTS